MPEGGGPTPPVADPKKKKREEYEWAAKNEPKPRSLHVTVNVMTEDGKVKGFLQNLGAGWLGIKQSKVGQLVQEAMDEQEMSDKYGLVAIGNKFAIRSLGAGANQFNYLWADTGGVTVDPRYSNSNKMPSKIVMLPMADPTTSTLWHFEGNNLICDDSTGCPTPESKGLPLAFDGSYVRFKGTKLVMTVEPVEFQSKFDKKIGEMPELNIGRIEEDLEHGSFRVVRPVM